MIRRLKFNALQSGLTAIAAVFLFSSALPAQQTIRTGDGLLTLSADMPDQMRVGESFTYNVEVTNASDNVILHDIKLEQRKTKGLTIESVSAKNEGSSNKQNSKNTDGSDGAKQKSTVKASGQQMTISMLKPGESRTLEVKATADEEGELRSCLEIASYTPAICLTSQVVKPQLELTKNAPNKVNRCEVIELEYVLKNGGSGDVGAIEITDSLGDGLATIEGSSDLKFDVDGLAAGDTRKFIARVYARKTGEFSSRATAKAKDSDLQSRSKQTSTKVISADLAASLDGPSRLYGQQLATFTAEVTNTGNTAAEDVRIQVMWPQQANLVDLGEPSMSSTKSQGQNKNQKNKQNQGQPTLAEKQDSQSSGNSQSSDSSSSQASNDSGQSNKQAKNKSSNNSNSDKQASNNSGNNSNKNKQANNKSGNDSNNNKQASNKSSNNSNKQASNDSSSESSSEISMEMAQETIVLDRLEAGQTATFEYAVRPEGLEELPSKVVATWICSVGPAQDQAKATARSQAAAMATAKVVRLPAMQLMVVDDEDPVTKGGEVVYTIRVWNEGDAEDSNVRLTAELPEGLEYVSATGPTEATQNGSTIEFDPIDTMEPGDRADYRVTAKGTGSENVRFAAQLTSNKLSSEVTAEEPTRLFQR